VAEVLGVDVGPDRVAALVVGDGGTLRGRAVRDVPGGEVDVDALWSALQGACRGALAEAGVAAAGLAGLGLATPRDVLLAWSRATLRPVATAPRGGGLGRLLDGDDGVRDAAERGDLAAGTLDAWLLARLTNGDVEATEPSNAGATGLYDPRTRAWDRDRAARAGVPLAVLPALRPSAAAGAVTDPAALLGAEVPVTGVAARGAAALLGHGGAAPGTARTDQGPGGDALALAGPPSEGRPAGPGAEGIGEFVATVAWDLGDGPVVALAGPGALLPRVTRVDELRVDGPVAADGPALVAWADLAGVPVVVPAERETAALGAALLAGVGAGAWDLDGVAAAWAPARRIDPRPRRSPRAAAG